MTNISSIVETLLTIDDGIQGIYVTTEEAALLGKKVGFGVRLEDPILVTEDGGVLLTGNRAQSPWSP